VTPQGAPSRRRQRAFWFDAQTGNSSLHEWEAAGTFETLAVRSRLTLTRGFPLERGRRSRTVAPGGGVKANRSGSIGTSYATRVTLLVERSPQSARS
jgi:hypothetical protein